MIEWVPTADGVAAVGRNGSVRLARTDWERTPPALPLPYPSDAGIAGRLTALELDAPAHPDGLPTDGYVPDGEHVVAVGRDDDLEAAVRFEGPARVATAADSTRLAFPEPSPVAVGVRDAPPAPETIPVPRTPAGWPPPSAWPAGGSPTAPNGPSRPSDRIRRSWSTTTCPRRGRASARSGSRSPTTSTTSSWPRRSPTTSART
ncbi:hypothetical protein [Halosegnis marinus]|uniref:hypothetical protein n=1 Tax=Halosegnis marinus TaxID=3034023 RepID=UPI0036229A99